MATMKSNNTAIAAMQQMLQERCIAEPTFAIKMANPSKSMEGAVNYLCGQIQKSGLCCVDDATVMNILVHYFDENEIEEGGTPQTISTEDSTQGERHRSKSRSRD